MSTVPKPLSDGEETFAMHCAIYGLTPMREAELIPGRKWRCDFYFREKDLAVEIEGGVHRIKGRFVRDVAKYNALARAGVMVLRYTTAMVRSGEAIDEVVSIVKEV